MEEKLQTLLKMDDYIQENAAAKITLETLPWSLEQPQFDLCETEAQCSDQQTTLKDGSVL